MLKLALHQLTWCWDKFKRGINGCIIYLLLHKINSKPSDLISTLIDVLSPLISVGERFGKGSEGRFSIETLMSL